MEGSIMGAPLLSSSATGVLELHHHQQALAHLQGLAPLSTTQHIHGSLDCNQAMLMESKGTPKASFMCSKGKSTGTSDEDERSFMEEGDDHMEKSKKSSPWQRMKWTNCMVKLLINAILFVGEDGIMDSTDGNNKRKLGYLQKKGKWKSVSRVLMERGCYVSPQQCEDKFNDLNKRYKRLSDILGQATAHHIVENPNLLDDMDNIPLKVKEEAKKILSSKHLFYREMRDYHNGCKSSMAGDSTEFQPSLHNIMLCKNQDLDADEDAEDDDEEDLDDHLDDMRVCADIGGVGDSSVSYENYREPLKYYDSFSCRSKCLGLEPLSSNLALMTQDGTTLTADQKQLTRIRLLQLEERKVSIQAQALELEKQRFKWQRLNSRKGRDLERIKLEKERKKLETDRISLNLKQKELEAEFRRSEDSMALILEKLQSKDQNELVRSHGMG